MDAATPGWSISFGCDTTLVPPEVLALVEEHLQDMGHALRQLGPMNPFWDSVQESGLRLDVGGWRFQFRVDREAVTCIEVEPTGLRPPATASSLRSR